MRSVIRKIVDKSPLLKAIDDLRVTYIVRRNKKLAVARLRKYGPEIYNLIDSLFAEKGVKYFADYGSLLGLIREKGFVPTDDDVDFSIVDNSIEPTDLIRFLLSRGFEYLRAFKYDGKITEVSLKYKGVPVDFFYLQYDGGDNYAQAYYWSDEANGWRGLRQLRDKVGALVPYELSRIKTMIPENYDALLTGHYGDWRVPNSKWYYATDAQEKVNIDLPHFASILSQEEIDEILTEK